MRYHKTVYFSAKHQEDIIAFTYALMSQQRSSHMKDCPKKKGKRFSRASSFQPLF